jgi:hypothetical protein
MRPGRSRGKPKISGPFILLGLPFSMSQRDQASGAPVNFTDDSNNWGRRLVVFSRYGFYTLDFAPVEHDPKALVAGPVRVADG